MLDSLVYPTMSLGGFVGGGMSLPAAPQAFTTLCDAGHEGGLRGLMSSSACHIARMGGTELLSSTFTVSFPFPRLPHSAGYHLTVTYLILRDPYSKSIT